MKYSFQDIQNFLDDATHGAIFFSLGSFFRTEKISNKSVEAIFTVFSRLPLKVLMKWDTEDVKLKSDNIMISKWLPQSDILAHPNTKLFISHCGLGSVIESKYHGVPILALPMFSDQFINAKIVTREGWAIEMELQSLETKDFEEVIKELIYNKR